MLSAIAVISFLSTILFCTIKQRNCWPATTTFQSEDYVQEQPPPFIQQIFNSANPTNDTKANNTNYKERQETVDPTITKNLRNQNLKQNEENT